MKWWSDLNTNLAFCHPQPHTRHCRCRIFHLGCCMWCFFPPHQIRSHLNPHLLLCHLLRVVSTFVSFGSLNCSKKSSNGSLRASLYVFACAWVVYSSSLSKSQNQIHPHYFFVKCNIMSFWISLPLWLVYPVSLLVMSSIMIIFLFLSLDSM